jgi:uncharacterized protein YjbI with pentapeptide repeats
LSSDLDTLWLDDLKVPRGLLAQLSNLQLLSLRLLDCNFNSRALRLSPGLVDLALTGSRFSCAHLVLPPTVRDLDLSGSDASKQDLQRFSLSDLNLRSLSLRDCVRIPSSVTGVLSESRLSSLDLRGTKVRHQVSVTSLACLTRLLVDPTVTVLGSRPDLELGT